MNCSRCSAEYQTLEYKDQTIHFCPECSLFWFTQGQLERIDIASDDFKELTESLEMNSEESSPEKEKCTLCEIVLHYHSYASAPHVKIGECYNCGGVALDNHQIKDIRENSMTPLQLQAYLDQMAHSVPGFTQANYQQKNKGFFHKFVRLWQKLRFWAKKED